MALLKSRGYSTSQPASVSRLWMTSDFVHMANEADEGVVEGIFYDHPQSTAPTTATTFEILSRRKRRRETTL
jgi:hypothetical protein